MKVTTIQSGGLSAKITVEGKRFIVGKNKTSRLQMDLLPFDCGVEQPAYYESFKQVHLDVGIPGGNKKKKAVPVWKMEAKENGVTIHKKICGWILSQEITTGTAGFKIHTLITRPAGGKFPSSLNIFRMPARDLLRKSKIFRTGGVMGDISIQEANGTAEGSTGTGKEPVYKTWWFARNDEFENIKVSEYYQNLHNLDRTLSLEEARTHASLELMLGGAYVLGDPVHYLNKNGLALYYKVLEAQKAPGRPLDLFEEDGLPGTWVQESKDKVRIGFFNLGQKPLEFSIGLNRTGVQVREGVDFWSEEKLPINSNIVNLKVNPHHCRVLEFSK